jgi:excisionase family DNA binding protein
MEGGMAGMSSKKARKERRATVVQGSRVGESPKTVREAAVALGLSVHTVRAWVAARKIGYVRLGRAIRIPAAEIQRVIEKGTIPAQRQRGAA